MIPIVFSADGKTLITGSDDRTIRWWSVTMGNEMLLSQDALTISRDVKPEADMNPGGNLAVWQEIRGPIRATALPTLAEIDARERARNKSP